MSSISKGIAQDWYRIIGEILPFEQFVTK